jgi:hypothetical protein
LLETAAAGGAAAAKTEKQRQAFWTGPVMLHLPELGLQAPLAQVRLVFYVWLATSITSNMVKIVSHFSSFFLQPCMSTAVCLLQSPAPSNTPAIAACCHLANAIFCHPKTGLFPAGATQQQRCWIAKQLAAQAAGGSAAGGAA